MFFFALGDLIKLSKKNTRSSLVFLVIFLGLLNVVLCLKSIINFAPRKEGPPRAQVKKDVRAPFVRGGLGGDDQKGLNPRQSSMKRREAVEPEDGSEEASQV